LQERDDCSLFGAPDLNSACFLDRLSALNKSMRRVYPEGFVGPAREFKRGASNGTTKVKGTLNLPDLWKKLGHASQREKERIPRPESVWQLILCGPVVKKEILVEKKIGFVHARHREERRQVAGI
jgi:hypothetical protein